MTVSQASSHSGQRIADRSCELERRFTRTLVLFLSIVCASFRICQILKTWLFFFEIAVRLIVWLRGLHRDSLWRVRHLLFDGNERKCFLSNFEETLNVGSTKHADQGQSIPFQFKEWHRQPCQLVFTGLCLFLPSPRMGRKLDADSGDGIIDGFLGNNRTKITNTIDY